MSGRLLDVHRIEKHEGFQGAEIALELESLVTPGCQLFYVILHL